MNEQLYAKKWKRRQEINERALYAFIHTKLNIETKSYLKSLEGRNPNTFWVTSNFSQNWMLEMLKEAWMKFGIKQGKFLQENQNKALNDEDFYNAWLIFMATFFSNMQNWLILLSIVSTIKKDIERFVKDKIDQGIPTNAIITMLGLYLIQNNIIRATTIARTETTRIMNNASVIWANNSGVELMKKWIVILDGKERASHNAMASHPSIPMSAKFNVGGYMMNAPGDSSAPAQEVVNCRCGLMFI